MLWYGNELWKGTGTETRKTSIVEDKLKKEPASKKRCSSTFVNESFNCNSSSLVTQSFLNPKRDRSSFLYEQRLSMNLNNEERHEKFKSDQ